MGQSRLKSQVEAYDAMAIVDAANDASEVLVLTTRLAGGGQDHVSGLAAQTRE